MSARTFGVLLDENEEQFATNSGIIAPQQLKLPLRAMSSTDALKFVRSYFRKRPTFRTHHPVKYIRRALNSSIWHSLTIVGVTRNPFDRATSWFFWWLYKNGIDLPPHGSQIVKLFRGWIDDELGGVRKRANRVHIIDGASVVNIWVRFESLKTDLEGVTAQLFPHVNSQDFLAIDEIKMKANIRPPLYEIEKLFVEPEIVERIVDAFSWDFENLGYETKPPWTCKDLDR